MMPDRATITDAVKSKYGTIARSSGCCATEDTESCCATDVPDLSRAYMAEELASLPSGAVLGLGCGNPIAHSGIKPGEVVVDLGSGAGVDCFLAAKVVGDRGLVIGVDMTEAMLERAQANAESGGFANVEFRRGEIEDLPIESGTADLVISNCVINLAPDKRRVFREIRRVLKPGGRFSVSDIVFKGHIPDQLREDLDQWACCVGGAMERDEYLKLASEMGFDPVEVKAEVDYDYRKTDEFSLASITVVGYKPDSGDCV